MKEVYCDCVGLVTTLLVQSGKGCSIQLQTLSKTNTQLNANNFELFHPCSRSCSQGAASPMDTSERASSLRGPFAGSLEEVKPPSELTWSSSSCCMGRHSWRAESWNGLANRLIGVDLHQDGWCQNLLVSISVASSVSRSI